MTLEVPRRFGKRDGNTLSIASSKLENENAVSKSLETGGSKTHAFELVVTSLVACCEEWGRGLKKGSCSTAYGKRARRVWRAGGRKAGTTGGINLNRNSDYVRWPAVLIPGVKTRM